VPDVVAAQVVPCGKGRVALDPDLLPAGDLFDGAGLGNEIREPAVGFDDGQLQLAGGFLFSLFQQAGHGRVGPQRDADQGGEAEQEKQGQGFHGAK